MEGKTNGRIVFDGSIWPIKKLASPLTAVIENGVRGEFEGPDAERFRATLEPHGPEAFAIAELGIGTNDAATLTGNVLEDEKILGSIHVAFGDNHSFSGTIRVVAPGRHRVEASGRDRLTARAGRRAPSHMSGSGTTASQASTYNHALMNEINRGAASNFATVAEVAPEVEGFNMTVYRLVRSGDPARGACGPWLPDTRGRCHGIPAESIHGPRLRAGSPDTPTVLEGRSFLWGCLMRADTEVAYQRLLSNPGVVFLLGGIDTGKTTFGIELAQRAAAAGVPTAIVDADTVQSTIGPPTTVGLRHISGETTLTREELRRADGLGFVGSHVPKGHLLPLVTNTAKLARRAKEAGARLVIVDTTSLVSGIYGQSLKFFKMDLLQPDYVIAFERGGELEPVVGNAQRFTPAEVLELEVSPEAQVRSVEERITFREEQFAAYFSGATSRWRVKPTVFMPTLPPDFDLALLDDLVVGMEDGRGSCSGIGVLEYDSGEDILRMISPVSEGVKGLRLGSVRIDTSGRSKGPVDLRQLFGSE